MKTTISMIAILLLTSASAYAEDGKRRVNVDYLQMEDIVLRENKAFGVSIVEIFKHADDPEGTFSMKFADRVVISEMGIADWRVNFKDSGYPAQLVRDLIDEDVIDAPTSASVVEVMRHTDNASRTFSIIISDPSWEELEDGEFPPDVRER